MDPEDVQSAANEASSAMGPLAQVVSAYYHGLMGRDIPYPLAQDLVRDFQDYYLNNPDGDG